MSSQTLEAFTAYLAQDGPSGFRHKKLAELIKALDWMSLPELRQTPLGTLLKQLNTASKGAFSADLQAFAQQQQATKLQQADKRKAYQLKIIHHYRNTLNASDKALLEALRDYELDRTSHDLNWQHYFKLNSLKKIDAFATATLAQRTLWITQFKQDVASYTQNANRWKQDSLESDAYLFDFDAWCDTQDETTANKTGQQQQSSQPPKPANTLDALTDAWQQMEMPPSTNLASVKRQFRALTMRYHPDVTDNNGDHMRRIIVAYDRIKQHLKA
jgi:hypothetical protein